MSSNIGSAGNHNPRKFAEKIALQKQKAKEDTERFNEIINEIHKAKAAPFGGGNDQPPPMGNSRVRPAHNGGMHAPHTIAPPATVRNSGGAPGGCFLNPSYALNQPGGCSRAGSLPNVTALLKHNQPRNSIDLQSALVNLNDLKGSMEMQDAGGSHGGGSPGRLSRSGSGQRTSPSNFANGPNAVSNGPRNRHDISPYGNPAFLAPPANAAGGDNWRRTISDSRLYENAIQPGSTPFAMAGGPTSRRVHRRSIGNERKPSLPGASSSSRNQMYVNAACSNNAASFRRSANNNSSSTSRGNDINYLLNGGSPSPDSSVTSGMDQSPVDSPSLTLTPPAAAAGTSQGQQQHGSFAGGGGSLPDLSMQYAASSMRSMMAAAAINHPSSGGGQLGYSPNPASPQLSPDVLFPRFVQISTSASSQESNSGGGGGGSQLAYVSTSSSDGYSILSGAQGSAIQDNVMLSGREGSAAAAAEQLSATACFMSSNQMSDISENDPADAVGMSLGGQPQLTQEGSVGVASHDIRQLRSVPSNSAGQDRRLFYYPNPPSPNSFFNGGGGGFALGSPTSNVPHTMSSADMHSISHINQGGNLSQQQQAQANFNFNPYAAAAAAVAMNSGNSQLSSNDSSASSQFGHAAAAAGQFSQFSLANAVAAAAAAAAANNGPNAPLVQQMSFMKVSQVAPPSNGLLGQQQQPPSQRLSNQESAAHNRPVMKEEMTPPSSCDIMFSPQQQQQQQYYSQNSGSRGEHPQRGQGRPCPCDPIDLTTSHRGGGGGSDGRQRIPDIVLTSEEMETNTSSASSAASSRVSHQQPRPQLSEDSFDFSMEDPTASTGSQSGLDALYLEPLTNEDLRMLDDEVLDDDKVEATLRD